MRFLDTFSNPPCLVWFDLAPENWARPSVLRCEGVQGWYHHNPNTASSALCDEHSTAGMYVSGAGWHAGRGEARSAVSHIEPMAIIWAHDYDLRMIGWSREA